MTIDQKLEQVCREFRIEGDYVGHDLIQAGNVNKTYQVKFILPLPLKEAFNKTPTGRDRSENSKIEAWEQACRQSWRALKLVIQAKLEAVECGISVFEDEFMANIVLPGGDTVGEFMRPQIEEAYKLGTPPRMLMLE